MENRRNYYRILHVQPDAPREIIRTSYLTLMQRLKMHPDLGGDHWNAALINEAFATLMDPIRRASYDETMKMPARAGSGPSTAGRQPLPFANGPRRVGRDTPVCGFCGVPYPARDANRADAVCGVCQSPLCPAQKHPRGDTVKRAIERTRRTMSVHFEVTWPQPASFHGVSEDVSINGMRLITAFDLPIEQLLRLECDFCDAVGLVRHSREVRTDKGLRWSIGIEFVTLRVKSAPGTLLSRHA
jgi:hypothetical protein